MTARGNTTSVLATFAVCAVSTCVEQLSTPETGGYLAAGISAHVRLLQVERCWAVSTAGTVVDLRPSLEGVPPAPATFTPSANDRTHTTRATAVADRRMRPMQEVKGLEASVPLRSVQARIAWTQCVEENKYSLYIMGRFCSASSLCCYECHDNFRNLDTTRWNSWSDSRHADDDAAVQRILRPEPTFCL